jgi:hypothetical protein
VKQLQPFSPNFENKDKTRSPVMPWERALKGEGRFGISAYRYS